MLLTFDGSELINSNKQYSELKYIMPNSTLHQPVLLQQAITALAIQPNGIYIDCTFGRGGHSRAILSNLGTSGQIIAFDQDPDSIETAQSLSTEDQRFSFIHSQFNQLINQLKAKNIIGQVNGILLDLGMSSPQLDIAARGFSFLREGPLDMRMNPTIGLSVAEWLETAEVDEIAYILKTYGEERFAKRIARAIVATQNSQPLKTTLQLAELVSQSIPKQRGKVFKHPATRTFQALRIFINQELEQIEQVLPQTLEVLAPGGRLVVISFHSLEDRIVKHFIRKQARGDDFPPNLPVRQDQLNPKLKIISKPIMPNTTEIEQNPRSRSAVMRVAALLK